MNKQLKAKPLRSKQTHKPLAAPMTVLAHPRCAHPGSDALHTPPIAHILGQINLEGLGIEATGRADILGKHLLHLFAEKALTGVEAVVNPSVACVLPFLLSKFRVNLP